MGYTINSCIQYNKKTTFLIDLYIKTLLMNLTIEISIFYAIFLMLL